MHPSRTNFSRSDSHIMTRKHFQNESKDKISRARSVPMLFSLPKSEDSIPTPRGNRISVSENKGKLWFVKKNKKGREYLEFVIAQNFKKGFFNVKSYIDMQYASDRVPYTQFFDQLIKVFMGSQDTQKVGDLVYSSIPAGKELDFINNSYLALLRSRIQTTEPTGSLGRETSLVSKLFRAHFLKLYGPQLDKILLLDLKDLKKRCGDSQEKNVDEAILRTVDSVLNTLLNETKTNIPYDLRRLYRQTYMNCQNMIHETTAREQTVGNFFLIIVCPKLITSKVPGKIQDETLKLQFTKARTKVSKIIQHVANGTKPNSGDLSFAFEENAYQKRKEIVAQIIDNLINLD